ncbi:MULTISPECIES: Rha family transcriptional regulator [Robinsoniella]|uniref:Rha family transcriptional regulator n=1 Tax=Robinsoniella TaxID=588605 RepID=UPI000694A7C0|nr:MULTISPECIES: Rha family transcriptional regulator [Robinsoniella]
MGDLVIVNGCDVFTDSLVIADGTGNAHRSVLKLINKHSEYFTEFGELTYHLKWSDNSRNSQTSVCSLNETQATFLMTLFGNSPIVVKFKMELVKQFYIMRQLLLQKQTPIWQDTRSLSKQIRKKETDTIKSFIDYAKASGSTHSERYYTILTRLADKTSGIMNGQRDSATLEQLNTLCMAENIIERCIIDGISKQTEYKQIYQACKERLAQFSAIAFLAG